MEEESVLFPLFVHKLNHGGIPGRSIYVTLVTSKRILNVMQSVQLA